MNDMGGVMVDRDDIKAALYAISSDCDRETWVRVAMALKAELGDEGWALFDTWSAQSGKYREADAKSTWRSIHRHGGVTIKSLFRLARDSGWNTDKPVKIPPRRLTAPPKDAPDTQQYALKLWKAAGTGVAFHPYAKAKGITWEGGARRGRASGRIVGQDADCLIVPVRDLQSFEVVAIQAINSKGDKQTFGPIRGHAFVCGNTEDLDIPWFVVEGWADAVSTVFHIHKGNACAFAAMGKGQMEDLAKRIADRYQPDRVVILEDAA